MLNKTPFHSSGGDADHNEHEELQEIRHKNRHQQHDDPRRRPAPPRTPNEYVIIDTDTAVVGDGGQEKEGGGRDDDGQLPIGKNISGKIVVPQLASKNIKESEGGGISNINCDESASSDSDSDSAVTTTEMRIAVVSPPDMQVVLAPSSPTPHQAPPPPSTATNRRGYQEEEEEAIEKEEGRQQSRQRLLSEQRLPPTTTNSSSTTITVKKLREDHPVVYRELMHKLSRRQEQQQQKQQQQQKRKLVPQQQRKPHHEGEGADDDDQDEPSLQQQKQQPRSSNTSSLSGQSRPQTVATTAGDAAAAAALAFTTQPKVEGGVHQQLRQRVKTTPQSRWTVRDEEDYQDGVPGGRNSSSRGAHEKGALLGGLQQQGRRRYGRDTTGLDADNGTTTPQRTRKEQIRTVLIVLAVIAALALIILSGVRYVYLLMTVPMNSDYWESGYLEGEHPDDAAAGGGFGYEENKDDVRGGQNGIMEGLFSRKTGGISSLFSTSSSTRGGGAGGGGDGDDAEEVNNKNQRQKKRKNIFVGKDFRGDGGKEEQQQKEKEETEGEGDEGEDTQIQDEEVLPAYEQYMDRIDAEDDSVVAVEGGEPNKNAGAADQLLLRNEYRDEETIRDSSVPYMRLNTAAEQERQNRLITKERRLGDFYYRIRQRTPREETAMGQLQFLQGELREYDSVEVRPLFGASEGTRTWSLWARNMVQTAWSSFKTCGGWGHDAVDPVLCTAVDFFPYNSHEVPEEMVRSILLLQQKQKEQSVGFDKEINQKVRRPEDDGKNNSLSLLSTMNANFVKAPNDMLSYRANITTPVIGDIRRMYYERNVDGNFHLQSALDLLQQQEEVDKEANTNRNRKEKAASASKDDDDSDGLATAAERQQYGGQQQKQKLQQMKQKLLHKITMATSAMSNPYEQFYPNVNLYYNTFSSYASYDTSFYNSRVVNQGVLNPFGGTRSDDHVVGLSPGEVIKHRRRTALMTSIMNDPKLTERQRSRLLKRLQKLMGPPSLAAYSPLANPAAVNGMSSKNTVPGGGVGGGGSVGESAAVAGAGAGAALPPPPVISPPVSLSFNMIGALDTLWLAGVKLEFYQAVDWLYQHFKIRDILLSIHAPPRRVPFMGSGSSGEEGEVVGEVVAGTGTGGTATATSVNRTASAQEKVEVKISTLELTTKLLGGLLSAIDVSISPFHIKKVRREKADKTQQGQKQNEEKEEEKDGDRDISNIYNHPAVGNNTRALLKLATEVAETILEGAFGDGGIRPSSSMSSSSTTSSSSSTATSSSSSSRDSTTRSRRIMPRPFLLVNHLDQQHSEEELSRIEANEVTPISVPTGMALEFRTISLMTGRPELYEPVRRALDHIRAVCHSSSSSSNTRSRNSAPSSSSSSSLSSSGKEEYREQQGSSKKDKSQTAHNQEHHHHCYSGWDRRGNVVDRRPTKLGHLYFKDEKRDGSSSSPSSGGAGAAGTQGEETSSASTDIASIDRTYTSSTHAQHTSVQGTHYYEYLLKSWLVGEEEEKEEKEEGETTRAAGSGVDKSPSNAAGTETGTEGNTRRSSGQDTSGGKKAESEWLETATNLIDGGALVKTLGWLPLGGDDGSDAAGDGKRGGDQGSSSSSSPPPTSVQRALNWGTWDASGCVVGAYLAESAMALAHSLQTELQSAGIEKESNANSSTLSGAVALDSLIAQVKKYNSNNKGHGDEVKDEQQQKRQKQRFMMMEAQLQRVKEQMEAAEKVVDTCNMLTHRFPSGLSPQKVQLQGLVRVASTTTSTTKKMHINNRNNLMFNNEYDDDDNAAEGADDVSNERQQQKHQQQQSEPSSSAAVSVSSAVSSSSLHYSDLFHPKHMKHAFRATMHSELFETYFWLYRATGDPKYRDWAAELMQSVISQLYIGRSGGFRVGTDVRDNDLSGGGGLDGNNDGDDGDLSSSGGSQQSDADRNDLSDAEYLGHFEGPSSKSLKYLLLMFDEKLMQQTFGEEGEEGGGFGGVDGTGGWVFNAEGHPLRTHRASAIRK